MLLLECIMQLICLFLLNSLKGRQTTVVMTDLSWKDKWWKKLGGKMGGQDFEKHLFEFICCPHHNKTTLGCLQHKNIKVLTNKYL